MIKKKSRYGKYFIIPFFVVFTIFTLIPLLFTFVISFTEYDRFTTTFIGLDNYIGVLTDQVFWKSFVNTWILWGVGFAIQLSLTMIISTMLMDVRLRIKRVGFFRTVFFLPNLMSMASVAILFSLILGPNENDALNSFLINIGLIDSPIAVLTNVATARMSVSMINAWLWFGNSTILIMAGMTSVSKDLYESAWIDGANRWQVYKDITIPSIKPTLTYVLVTSLIGGMQTFDIAYLLPPVVGGPEKSLLSMGIYLYQNAFIWMRVGYAAALSIIMFILISIFANIIKRALGEA